MYVFISKLLVTSALFTHLEWKIKTVWFCSIKDVGHVARDKQCMLSKLFIQLFQILCLKVQLRTLNLLSGNIHGNGVQFNY